MKKKDELCSQYETNSLDNKSFATDKQILKTTIAFLKEQMITNHHQCEHIRNKLDLLKVDYTYQNDQSIELLDTVFDQPGTLEEVQTMIQDYNRTNEKNQRISKNIHDLQERICTQFESEYSNTTVTNEIGAKGISILDAQETERSRIACDLHDSVVQTLASLVHKTELCIRTVDRDPVGVKLDLQIMMQNTKGVIDEIRSIIYNLRPMALDDLGLETAIRRFLECFEQNNNISIVFKNDCNDLIVDDSVISLTVFRIIQEACSNAVKHGKASHIEVKLSNDETYIRLNIKDNGCGFDINENNTKGRLDHSGFGLSIMKERVYLLSGIIDVKSDKNNGTDISVIVPITKR